MSCMLLLIGSWRKQEHIGSSRKKKKKKKAKKEYKWSDHYLRDRGRYPGA